MGVWPTGQGGPPIIADFDGDGRAELGTSGGAAYTVLDPDCRGTPDKATCASLSTDGVLWSRPSQGNTPNLTGSSAFDVDGDGRAEVAYSDECFTRLYDGATGKVLYSRARTTPYGVSLFEIEIYGDHVPCRKAEVLAMTTERVLHDRLRPEQHLRQNSAWRTALHEALRG